MTTSATSRDAVQKKRALVVKLGAIGDVVMTIPAVHALHLEGYEVDWLCGQAAAAILKLYPWLRVIEADERALLRGGTAVRAKAMLDVWRRLAGQRYDLCATLYYDRRYAMLTWPVRAKCRIFLSESSRAGAVLPGRHYTDEYARILLQQADDERTWQLAPLRAEGLDRPAVARDTDRVRVAIVPGGAKNMLRDNPLRRWPVECYVALAKELTQRGCEIVLIGGPEDAWVTESFAGMEAVNAVGRFSLVETLALLESSAVTVTHDTGPLHLAGITSTAIVSIFGPTRPHSFMPQRENCVAIWGGEGFACRPCYDGREFAPCSNNGCMQQVTVSMVVAEVERMLEARRDGNFVPPRVVLPQHTSVRSPGGI